MLQGLNFNEKRESLLKVREEICRNGVDSTNYSMFINEVNELLEATIFSIMISDDNYFSNVLLQIERVNSFAIATPISHKVSNQGLSLLINPLLIINYDIEQIKVLLIHESYHIINEHYKRMDTYKNLVPNTIILLASDLVVNEFLGRRADLIPGWFTIERMNEEFDMNLNRDNSVENLIEKLKTEMVRNEKFAEFVIEKEKLYNKDFRDMLHKVTETNLGKYLMQYVGEDGIFVSDGLSDLLEAEFFLDEIVWGEGIDTDLIGDFIKQVVVEAASQTRGNLPAGLDSIIEKLTKPPVISWEQAFAKYLGTIACSKKSTPFRLNRRQPSRLDLKGTLPDKEVSVVCAIDTSGSMDDMRIAECIKEIFAITKNIKCEITIIECDCEIGKVYKANSPEEVNLEVTGRGGTAFTPVFDYINENNMNDSVVVYFTDGYGEGKINCKVNTQGIIWVLTDDEGDLSLKGDNLPMKSIVKSLNIK